MGSDHTEEERKGWQDDLETRFAPAIDSSLIAALVNEPEQTYNGVYATLLSLAGEEGEHATAGEGTPGSDHSGSARFDVQDIDRALAEWKLGDEDAFDAENLRLTDDEDACKAASSLEKEAVRTANLAASGRLPVDAITAGQVDISGAQYVGDQLDDGFAFLTHAFPTRTPAFLREMLDDEQGDVMRAVETLMTLEVVENGGLDEPSAHGADRLTDDKRFFDGTRAKKMSKRDRQRRKQEEAQSHGIVHSKHTNPQRVNLTDVRQGAAPTRKLAGRKLGKDTRTAWTADAAEGEDDKALAERLAREERIAAGLPADDDGDWDDAVHDNDWLFSSSVLDQLSVLLGVPDHVVKGTHAACHMNLRATLHRLVYMQCQAYPTLASLDARTQAEEGTSEAIIANISTLLPSKSRKEVEELFRATGGREDAVLDLAQLADRIETSATGEQTDILDPMMSSRKTAEVYAPTTSLQAANNAGHFIFVDGDPQRRGTAAATPYASAAGRKAVQQDPSSSARQHAALQRLQQGAASVTFPLNSAAHSASDDQASVPGGSHAESAAQAAKQAHEYTTIAQDYRQRRQEYLSKAASSYRSTHNAAISRGPMRGAAAWVYAEEARRLDAKARAFALQAAQATVRYRTLVNRSNASAGNGHPSSSSGVRHGDVVDLHGLTVHQALSITRQSLNTWWSAHQFKPSVDPLHVITGVGRHSRGQVALIRPAVLAMLQRERWSCREQQAGHIVVIGRHSV